MDKSIGIVICNYNKQDYILNCIKSVLDSSISDFDIYVVDNASTDDSVSCIQKEFENKITLIVNNENIGGSGGFNTGLRAALKKNYKYIMLMDNDIVADSKAVEELYLFMEQNPEVGMVGSKVYFMDYPNQIWGYGGHIDFEDYIQKDHYKNMVDSDIIPEVDYCDYVAACSLMARTDAIKKVGLMPEDNFIYWDDIEWGYRFNQQGYKVAVCGKSKIWHKAGGRNSESTFIHYYMWRNRICFFLKNLSPDKREIFAEIVLTEMFRMIYSVNLKGEFNVVRTLMHAYHDAVHGVNGKCRENKILERPKVDNRLEKALNGAKSVLIKFNGNFEGLGNIIRNIRGFASDTEIIIASEKSREVNRRLQEQFVDCQLVTNYQPECCDFHLIQCEHIFKITPDMKKDNYIDTWCNIIYSDDDFTYASSFEQAKALFLLCNKDLLKSC